MATPKKKIYCVEYRFLVPSDLELPRNENGFSPAIGLVDYREYSKIYVKGATFSDVEFQMRREDTFVRITNIKLIESDEVDSGYIVDVESIGDRPIIVRPQHGIAGKLIHEPYLVLGEDAEGNVVKRRQSTTGVAKAVAAAIADVTFRAVKITAVEIDHQTNA